MRGHALGSLEAGLRKPKCLGAGLRRRGLEVTTSSPRRPDVRRSNFRRGKLERPGLKGHAFKKAGLPTGFIFPTPILQKKFTYPDVGF